ncbi:uncharacterized protein BO88DRAFT_246509 [Aspergillus vadensis CBS 113365]|uniref:Uncharacterized protein n=1 Tax=Aspergillus vadensis (strain CBS 113365 / IMI 142717 / IBT 24658) TaxID=1448311 RepID=A0A319BEL0_ASPVC|nr:hypothetical protein BO88DRAFT_246509 [Aspergillus vadensis CBS 113365]PYH71165.1 hypothetical protein BO88DRAFT_246509 [Aspergillus vadensis CBS 113365]
MAGVLPPHHKYPKAFKAKAFFNCSYRHHFLDCTAFLIYFFPVLYTIRCCYLQPSSRQLPHPDSLFELIFKPCLVKDISSWMGAKRALWI